MADGGNMLAKKRRRAAEACIGSGVPKDLHGSLLGVRVFVGLLLLKIWNLVLRVVCIYWRASHCVLTFGRDPGDLVKKFS